jgi:hypothetical protein
MFHKKGTVMAKGLRTIGIILALLGVGFVVAGGVALARVNDGYDSLQSFSGAQNVTLSYNEEGQLIDRGTTEGAEAIMDLLVNDWAFPVVESDLDPNDPQVNTATEYMFQMATIGYHVLTSTQTVVLAEDVEYNGEVFPAGTYEFEVDGRYWADFDRAHPVEGPARSEAWTASALGQIAQLAVGTVTASTLQMGLALSGLFAGVGFFALVTGLGLVWAASKDEMFNIKRLVAEMERKEEASIG